jgi:hypothetical protein
MQGNSSCIVDCRDPNLFVGEESPAWKRICILQAINLTPRSQVRHNILTDMNILLMSVSVFFVS